MVSSTTRSVTTPNRCGVRKHHEIVLAAVMDFTILDHQIARGLGRMNPKVVSTQLTIANGDVGSVHRYTGIELTPRPGDLETLQRPAARRREDSSADSYGRCRADRDS